MAGAGLPSGDVTFVFTDIEGSTALLRELGDDYASLLDRHREILRKAWGEFGGHELGTEGDSFLVAFGDADAAVAACAQGHAGLSAEPWPNGVKVRVRMGMHRGLATPRNGEYVSMTIHQAARICSAAHGGQTLLSDAVVLDWTGHDAAALESLGRYRVRDFDTPVSIYRTAGIGTVERAPRLLPAEGHNLVPPPGSLVGRSDEIVELSRLIRPATLTTVVGPGGVGKTRLAIETGLHTSGDWPDGVWLVNLGTLTDESGLATAVGTTLGASPGRDGDAWDGVISFLANATVLLMLDNCEHLFPEVSVRVAEILEACPSVGLLCTSRETLGLREEHVFRLDPLATVGVSDGRSEAAQLFIDRTGPHHSDSDVWLDGVDELCEELDGLPLAIELAASRGVALSPTEILGALKADASTLESRDPRIPERQRTLHRTLAWSHGLLTRRESETFAELAVFAGGFTAQAAAAALDLEPADAGLQVQGLVERSLVLSEPAAGETRFRMLKTVRNFAMSLLDPFELASVQRRLIDRYLDDLGPRRAVETGWPGRVTSELDNIWQLAAHAVGVPSGGRQELAWTIGKLSDVRARYRTGAADLALLLDSLPEETPARVGMLTMRADLLLRMGAVDEADHVAQEAMALSDRVGRPDWDDAGVWRTLGVISLRRGEPAQARHLVAAGLSQGLSDLGAARLQALAGISWGQEGDLDSAVSALSEQLRLCEQSRLDSHLPGIHGNLAEAYFGLGNRRLAAEHQLACLDLAGEFGQTTSVAFSFVLAAQLSAKERWESAAFLQGAADALLEEAGYVMFAADIGARESLISDLNARGRADAVADLLSAGGKVATAEAIERARDELVLTIERGTP